MVSKIVFKIRLLLVISSMCQYVLYSTVVVDAFNPAVGYLAVAEAVSVLCGLPARTPELCNHLLSSTT